jgi:hypothetical protein
MSNSLAIAALTEALRSLLDNGINADPNLDPNSDPDLTGTSVTALPLDKARSNMNGLQVNLFLYQMNINAAWRNQDNPRQTRPGDSGRPPLPLNLYYMLTTFGPEEDEILSHRLLGRAMSLLHDNGILDPALIQNALADNDLYQQIEHIRVTPNSMSLDELSNLWSTFQSPYRLSATYLATVVLIDSTLPPRSALPVLKRGADDRAPTAFAALWPSLSSLVGIWNLPLQPSPPAIPPAPPPGGRPTRVVQPVGEPALARLGETLVLRGQNLTLQDTTASFSHLLNPGLAPLPVGPGLKTQDLNVVLPKPDPAVNPTVLADWPCGFYQVHLVSIINGVRAVSNDIPFMLAPAIGLDTLTTYASPLTLGLTCKPRVRPEQEKNTHLLLGDRLITADAISTPADETQPSTLSFQIDLTGSQVGDIFTARLRVDGVDSLPFAIDIQKGTLMFDPDQQVRIV